MSTWHEADEELPSVDEIVEVWMAFGQGGSTLLRGYRIAGRTGGETLWLNALTHEPFPDGWRVTRWRKAQGESVTSRAGTHTEHPHKPA